MRGFRVYKILSTISYSNQIRTIRVDGIDGIGVIRQIPSKEKFSKCPIMRVFIDRPRKEASKDYPAGNEINND
jgi:hypothetical protein